MPLNQFILNTHEQYVAQLQVRNKWMVRLRWYYLILLTFVASASTLLTTHNTYLINHYLLLCALGVTVNVGLWLFLQRHSHNAEYYRAIAVVQILLDMSLASTAVYLQGGLASRATILYAIPILTSGVLFLGVYAYIAALFSSLSYALCLLLYQTYYPQAYQPFDTIVPIIFYSFVFFIIAIIVVQFSTLNAIHEHDLSYSQLLAMLRHQLRHPSSTIAALIDNLEQSTDYQQLPSSVRRNVRLIKKENYKSNSMLANLLQAADLQTQSTKPTRTAVDLVKVLHEAATSCGIANKRQDDLILHLPHEAAIVHAQHNQLMMAFNNLIENAFDFSTAGSPVTVSLSSQSSHWRIVIEDHGQGITPEQHRSLFARFAKFETDETENQASADFYKMGLGLYLSKTIIERLGGNIELASQPGKGTKIIIVLSKGEDHGKK